MSLVDYESEELILNSYITLYHPEDLHWVALNVSTLVRLGIEI